MKEHRSGGDAPEPHKRGPIFTLNEAVKQNKETWLVISGRIYDITHFHSKHPGGEEVLLEQVGRDATENFEDVDHFLDAQEMLDQYLIGEVHPCDRNPNASKVPNKSPSKESSSGQWLISVLGALVLGLMGNPPDLTLLNL
ncbi:cytochrome b5-like [Zootoca vivipara]|uniref:cytochrome b5-like n=1 Tax=Zootoca vivipara TaxID=8524 RepID=UPI0015920903|nr:cytochrome b5-like [Zootoca vivipara]